MTRLNIAMPKPGGAFDSTETNETLNALAVVIQTCDIETHGHCERVVAYSLLLGRALNLEQAQIEALRYGALFHDIGKIGIPDAILRKPGPLNADEWTMMREHPLIGLQILGGIKFLQTASLVVVQHHERWDGKGYPFNIQGDEIDRNARIFAVVDAFDAMISNRVYRRGASFDAAITELRRCAGRQFDPEVVQAFTEINEHEWRGAFESATVPMRSAAA